MLIVCLRLAGARHNTRGDCLRCRGGSGAARSRTAWRVRAARWRRRVPSLRVPGLRVPGMWVPSRRVPGVRVSSLGRVASLRRVAGLRRVRARTGRVTMPRLSWWVARVWRVAVGSRVSAVTRLRLLQWGEGAQQQCQGRFT